MVAEKGDKLEYALFVHDGEAEACYRVSLYPTLEQAKTGYAKLIRQGHREPDIFLCRRLKASVDINVKVGEQF